MVSCALEQNRNSQLLPGDAPQVIYGRREGGEGRVTDARVAPLVL